MRPSKRAAVVAMIGLAWGAAATEIPWDERASRLVPEATAAVAADLDGDGDLDILVASETDDAVRVSFNLDGAGVFFSAMQEIAGVGSPADLAVGDLDGDGDLDAVAASFGAPGALVWLENDGSPGSGLWPSHSIASSVTPIAVALADVDGDGDLDLLAASALDDGIAWYENDGAAVPSFAVHWVTRDTDGLGGVQGDCDGAADVAAADVDRDGDLDLVTACHDADRVAWHENTDGAGGFGAQQALDSTLDGARHVDVADLDGDGDIDVLASGALDGRVTRYLQGAAGFAAAEVVAVHTGAATLDAADPDEDGDVDVLMGHEDGVRWREHAGDLGFRTLAVEEETGGGPRAASWADLDGDGDLDVLVARYDGGEVTWYENETIHSSAAFPASAVDLLALDDIDLVAAGDLDGDGDADLVATSWLTAPNDPQGFFLLWSENTGAGFAPQERLANVANLGEDIALGDVDGDGDLDVLLSMSGTSSSVVDWWENDGDGTFSTSHRLAGARIWPDVELADLDGDGDLDVVAADQGFFDDIAAVWFENTDGAGAFAAAETIWEHPSPAESVAVADFDRDGDLDVAVATRTGPIVWLSNVTPGFGPAQTIHTPATIGGVLLAVADLDRDGWQDLVAFGQDGVVLGFCNLGDGSFAGAVALATLPDGGTPVALEVADLDGDGDPDLAVGSALPPRFSWLENLGGAGPSFDVHLLAGDGELGVLADAAIADLDGDGDLDLVHAGRNGTELGRWPNHGAQVRLMATDVAQRWLAGGTVYELFRLEAVHLGRAGDEAAELSELVLLIESGEGVPASVAEIGGTFADFGVWLDDGDGAFDPAGDLQLVTSWQVVGSETRIALSGFTVPAAGAADLWLVGTTAPDPALALRLTERASRRTLRHPGSNPTIRLREEPATDTATGWLDDDIDACSGPYELQIEGFTVVSGEVVCQAGTDLSARDVGSSGAAASLVLRAGRSVALGDGFSVGSGGRLRVEIVPSLLPEE